MKHRVPEWGYLVMPVSLEERRTARIQHVQASALIRAGKPLWVARRFSAVRRDMTTGLRERIAQSTS